MLLLQVCPFVVTVRGLFWLGMGNEPTPSYNLKGNSPITQHQIVVQWNSVPALAQAAAGDGR
jgi:hypothetical protein